MLSIASCVKGDFPERLRIKKMSNIPITQSAPSKSRPPSSIRQSSVRESTWTHFAICFSVFSMHITFGVPTSVRTAVACLLREDNET